MNKYGLTDPMFVEVRDNGSILSVERDDPLNAPTTAVVTIQPEDPNDMEGWGVIHLTDEQRVFVIKALGGRV